MLTGSAADHTGLDIVAYHPVTKRRLGITVKSRTRVSGSESTSVTIFKPKEGPRQKLRKACEAFACEPWVAVYVETDLSAHLYLTSLEHYDHKYRVAEPASQDTWKMGNLLTGQYLLDPELPACIGHI